MASPPEGPKYHHPRIRVSAYESWEDTGIQSLAGRKNPSRGQAGWARPLGPLGPLGILGEEGMLPKAGRLPRERWENRGKLPALCGSAWGSLR